MSLFRPSSLKPPRGVLVLLSSFAVPFWRLVCLLICLLAAPFLRGDGKEDGAHSSYGEAFDEGPRRKGPLLSEAEAGRVHFKVTTDSPEAQRFFEQGVAQLHAFWFYEAERSFRQTLLHDAKCGMAYWGLALANRSTPERAREFLKKTEALRPVLSAKERRWVDAYAPFFAKDGPNRTERGRKLVEALETLAFDYPSDIEVKLFLMLHLWENSYEGIPLTSYEALDALLREVLAIEPMHSGAHHLRIHLWNKRDDRRALSSAALCGQSGTGAAHLWHMPGHTFSSLKRYSDAAWQQEAAARVDHAWMDANGLMPDQIHNYAHNNDWLVENLLFLGRVEEAVKLAKNMVELPQLAPHTVVIGKAKFDAQRSSYVFGARRLVQVLLENELWEKLLQLRGTPYLRERVDVIDEAQRLNALIWACSETGSPDEAALENGRLKALKHKVRHERFDAADQAEKDARKNSKPAAEISRVVTDTLAAQLKRVERVDALIAEGALAIALAAGQNDEAGAQLVSATEMSKVRRARVQARLGSGADALKTIQDAAKQDGAQLLVGAALVEHLWREDKHDEARAEFGKVRKAAGAADLGLPALARLRPVADSAGISGDWRVRDSASKDVGIRPDLNTMGSARWLPRLAPAWVMGADRGGFMRLDAMRGKPVLMVFYLGSGCIHCIEQLNLLAPLVEKYKEAGVEILAVSTEALSELPKTNEQAKTGSGFPFPLLADPSLSTFKAYGAYDDFDEQALHGLFLIDGNGYLRWQNISFKPFAQVDWLLGECKRLLEIPARKSGE
jgi:peroxiredoxin